MQEPFKVFENLPNLIRILAVVRESQIKTAFEKLLISLEPGLSLAVNRC
jgi:hypothetical protein